MEITLLNDTKVGIAENILTDEECILLHNYAVEAKTNETVKSRHQAEDIGQYSSDAFMVLNEKLDYDLELLSDFWGSKNVFTTNAPEEIKALVEKLRDNSMPAFEAYLEAIDAPTRGFTRDLLAYNPIHVYSAGHSFEHHVDCHEYALVFYVSDPSEFEGGDLIYDAGPRVTPSRGVLVIAPSDMPHQVLEVTGGYRCSLTTFFSTTED